MFTYVEHSQQTGFFMFIETVRKFFPNSIIIDAALAFPITKNGWNVKLPSRTECRFDQPDFYVVLNLQDMLTQDTDGIVELRTIHNHFAGWADLSRVIVCVWPQRIKDFWPKSLHIVEFSTFQYNTWKQYKDNEELLRNTFDLSKKDWQHNFVCMNRHDKPHRRIAYSKLSSYGSVGNCSLQSKGYELAYPNKPFEDYEAEYDNFANLTSLDANLNSALFNIITESQYIEQHGIISEKTFNAIVAGQPFAVIGHQLALEDIKTLGFVTYDNVFDETYDHADNSNRIHELINKHPKLLQSHMHIDDMWEVYDYCADRINFNRDYFFAEFGPKLLDSFQKQLLEIWH